ncbi:preprotein translocase subunit SecA [Corynebacterium sp. 320]|uniref:DUF5926 family protein n=1 Tax=Corynebacterium TaxID=1716 RepID=UPI00125CC672|nr:MULTISPECIES: DUF5926 family protein [Corynebacterium]KAB1504370.1 preprotein translocase subunit SecA [Corynebacterium sp. 320]KAB1552532.1 preprotein translocase subunit SecA [Corynebacterium sp. 321]KAB1554253.1 preprotein translocase subunit SecA [Corynebacterium sp. 319]KAB3528506.1 preprotein translocase subunit SecA [Corynebacterium sp. 250]KAB3540003.1 preprotein translocase subunit SecA [Corynebacterium sp. 366]
MSKKNKNKEQLPEGMSRRQAKLAARAAERAKLQKDPRPYGGFAMESDLIALQEFVPSAHFQATVAGAEYPIHIATVLPGAVAALRRSESDGGEAFVALQTQRRGDNPNRDLAYCLNWALNAQPGASLDVGIADGTEPPLADLLDKEQVADIQVSQDFSWWLTEEALKNPQIAATLQRANDSVLPSDRVDASVPGAAWWINPGEKAHIRWVRPEEEAELLNALARLLAAGDLHLGEGSKFAGVFRTHDVLVPVWDLDNSKGHNEWADGLETLDAKISEALAATEPLTADEQKAKQTIVSREVTIR